MTSRPTFPPQTLREYAFLGDGWRGALVGPRGEIAWLCAPVWDFPAVFADLIGGPGVYAVTPTEPFVWGGYYEPGSLIGRSRWTTSSTHIECREALATPTDPHRLTLLRRVEAGDRPVSVEVVLDVAPGFGAPSRSGGWPERDSSGVWTGTVGDLHARWRGAEHARCARNGSLRLRLDVPGHEVGSSVAG